MTCKYALKNAHGRLICQADGKEPHGLCMHQKYCHQKCVWEISTSVDFCDRRDLAMKQELKALEQEKAASEKPEPVLTAAPEVAVKQVKTRKKNKEFVPVKEEAPIEEIAPIKEEIPAEEVVSE